MKFLQAIVLGLFISWLPLSLEAQSLGIRTGLNASKMFVKDEYHKYSDDFKLSPGLMAGFSLEFFTKRENFSIETGAFYITKGYRIDETRNIPTWEEYEYLEKMSLHYLEVPIHMKFSFPHQELRFYLLMGGYFGYGISGKVYSKAEFRGQEYTAEEEIHWGNNPQSDLLLRPDYGLSAGAGLHVKRLVFGISAQYALANISTYRERDNVVQNMGICAYVGFTLIK